MITWCVLHPAELFLEGVFTARSYSGELGEELEVAFGEVSLLQWTCGEVPPVLCARVVVGEPMLNEAGALGIVQAPDHFVVKQEVWVGGRVAIGMDLFRRHSEEEWLSNNIADLHYVLSNGFLRHCLDGVHYLELNYGGEMGISYSNNHLFFIQPRTFLLLMWDIQYMPN